MDILVTGHSHQPKNRKIKDVLLLNPGSPTVPRLADPTVMLLELNKKEVDVEVIKIGNPVCSALQIDKFKKRNNMSESWQHERKTILIIKKQKMKITAQEHLTN